MSEIADRYRHRADLFEDKVAAADPKSWGQQSPCEDWKAIDVLQHIIDMHGAMVSPLGRSLSPAPPAIDDPLGAFRAARADVEAILNDPELAGTVHASPMGETTAEQHIDQVVSDDLVLHAWDLARATGQDDTIDPFEVERMLPSAQQIPEIMRTPGAFGPGIVVFGPEVEVSPDSSAQDRLLGLLGRNPAR